MVSWPPGTWLSEAAVEAPPAPCGGSTTWQLLGAALGGLPGRACKRAPLPLPLLSSALRPASLWRCCGYPALALPALPSVCSGASELAALRSCFLAASGFVAPCTPLLAAPCN